MFVEVNDIKHVVVDLPVDLVVPESRWVRLLGALPCTFMLDPEDFLYEELSVLRKYKRRLEGELEQVRERIRQLVEKSVECAWGRNCVIASFLGEIGNLSRSQKTR